MLEQMWILFAGGFSLVALVVFAVSMNSADMLSMSVFLKVSLRSACTSEFVACRLDGSVFPPTCLCTVVRIYPGCVPVCVSVHD